VKGNIVNKKASNHDTVRRKLLLATACLPFSVNALEVNKYVSDVKNKNTKLDQSSNYSDYYHAWKKISTQEPIVYINGRHAMNSSISGSELVKQDFKADNIVNVNGLILSKYEGAVLAYLGSLS
jgi:hypothetical protein